jgi:uncharacterized protein YbdZ (MbtH family)
MAACPADSPDGRILWTHKKQTICQSVINHEGSIRLAVASRGMRWAGAMPASEGLKPDCLAYIKESADMRPLSLCKKMDALSAETVGTIN